MRDTAHLSMVEDCAYRRLLDAYYAREKALPPDARDCCKLARAASKLERDAVTYVLREFFELREDGYHQLRADKEIARFQDKQRKARASAEARWSKFGRNAEGLHSHCEGDTSAMRTHSEGNAPRARPQTPDTSTPPSLRSGGEARATRLPPNWEPDGEAWSWAVGELGSGDRLGRELAKFRDYWAGKAGADGRKLDWAATWRNWVRKAADDAKSRGNSTAGRESAVDRVRRANAAALEDGSEVLAPDGRDLRPQVDERTRGDADGTVVDGAFRVIGG